MSYQANDFANRIVKAQTSLQALKSSQIIGGDNMSYHEYNINGVSLSIPHQNYKYIAIVVEATSAFPLVSIQTDIYENGNQIMNCNGSCPIPNNGNRSSLLRYAFIQTDSLITVFWANGFNIQGKSINFNDPTYYIYAIETSNYSGNTVQFEIRNIKIKSSHRATCFCTTFDEGDLF